MLLVAEQVRTLQLIRARRAAARRGTAAPFYPGRADHSRGSSSAVSSPRSRPACARQIVSQIRLSAANDADPRPDRTPNSVQQAMESDYGKVRAGDAVTALDEAIRVLRVLTLALSFEMTDAPDHPQSRSFSFVA